MYPPWGIVSSVTPCFAGVASFWPHPGLFGPPLVPIHSTLVVEVSLLLANGTLVGTVSVGSYPVPIDGFVAFELIAG